MGQGKLKANCRSLCPIKDLVPFGTHLCVRPNYALDDAYSSMILVATLSSNAGK